MNTPGSNKLDAMGGMQMNMVMPLHWRSDGTIFLFQTFQANNSI
jgi:hypothetical protein